MMPLIRPIRIASQTRTEYLGEREAFAKLQEDFRLRNRPSRRLMRMLRRSYARWRARHSRDPQVFVRRADL